MPHYSVVVSAATGTSINTAFSAIASNIPLGYTMHYWNESASRVAFAIATSAPTSTTNDQFYCPAGAAGAKDSNSRQPVISSGMNLYLRTAQTSVVSNAVIVEFML